jgi:citrate lyase subunit beta/citryl-CoA lyase
MSDGRPLRSLVGVPLDRSDLVIEALAGEADGVMLDLADLVAASRKDVARANLENLDIGNAEAGVFVRVAAVSATESLGADLEVAVRAGVDGIVLPECEHPDQIRELDSRLGKLERRRGLTAATLKVLPLPETALAIRNYFDSLTASDRVTAAMFPSAKGGDLARDVGFVWSADGAELSYMRSKVVVDARAAGVADVLDGAWVDLDDIDGFERDTRRSRQFGYTGRFTIGVAQTDVANRVFSPSDDEVAAAQREIDAFAEAAARGVGMFTHEGRLVDIATVKHAERVVARAHRVREPKHPVRGDESR